MQQKSGRGGSTDRAVSRGIVMAAVALVLGFGALFRPSDSPAPLLEESVGSAINMHRMLTTEQLRPLWLTPRMRKLAGELMEKGQEQCAGYDGLQAGAASSHVSVLDQENGEPSILVTSSVEDPHRVVADLTTSSISWSSVLSNVFNEFGFARRSSCWLFTFGTRRAACGSGIVDDGEECDDNNLVGGDGCSSQCRVEPDYRCWQTFDQPQSKCARNRVKPSHTMKNIAADTLTRGGLAWAGYALSWGLLVLSGLAFVAILGLVAAIFLRPKVKDDLLEWMTQSPAKLRKEQKSDKQA